MAQFIRFLLLLFIIALSGNLDCRAQQDSLFIYTKASCANCKAVKQHLLQNKINFIEKDLADNNNAMEMLDKLEAAQYHQQIILPVIFLNKRLYHPAFQTKKRLEPVAIPYVMDTLVNQMRRGELHLPSLQLAHKESEASEQESDCDIQIDPICLVVAGFQTEPEAKALMSKLIKDGYIYAGIVYSSNQYRVYNKIFLNRDIATKELENERKIFKDGYLLEIKR